MDALSDGKQIKIPKSEIKKQPLYKGIVLRNILKCLHLSFAGCV